MAKTPTAWSGNIASEANRYTYDSATDTYDSATQTYDGVVSTDMSDNTKTPAAWTATGKTPTAWTSTTKNPTQWNNA